MKNPLFYLWLSDNKNGNNIHRLYFAISHTRRTTRDIVNGQREAIKKLWKENHTRRLKHA